jgi:formiminotetrahydrofolate cyclodeaminase
LPDLDQFLEALSSGEPVPGGGSAAALEVAVGAALLAMVCMLTVGRPRFQEVREEVESIHVKALSCRDHARHLVDADADAYSAVAQALALPHRTDEERGVRSDAVQAALRGAVQPPLETMTVAAEAIQLAYRLAQVGNPSAISDVGSAALALHAGFYAARFNVDVNLAGIHDPLFRDQVRANIAALPDIDAFYSATMEMVKSAIGGEE